MRAFARFVMPFAAAIGLTVAFGSAAGATTTGFVPVVQVVNFPTGFSITNPCNGAAVDTTGHGTVSTTTLGQHTAVSIADIESGDGYLFIQHGLASFNSLASQYLVPVKATWFDSADPALNFHASYKETVTVNSRNRPTDFFVTGVSGTCNI
jgi:hypothetical protein